MAWVFCDAVFEAGNGASADLTVRGINSAINFGRDIQFYNIFKQKGRANGVICAETDCMI